MGLVADRRRALTRFRAFVQARRSLHDLPLNVKVVLWMRHLERAPTRTGRPPLPVTLKAYLRHLHGAMRRLNPPVHLYSHAEIADLRDHYGDLAKRRMSTTATTATPEDVMYVISNGGRGVALPALLIGLGAARHKELRRQETRFDPQTYQLWRVPKRGTHLTPYQLPRSTLTTRLVTEGVVGDRIVVGTLSRFNDALTKAVQPLRPGMRITSYSLRHGAIAHYLTARFTPDQIRSVTAHRGEIPATYLRHSPPTAKTQMALADHFLKAVGTCAVPDSDVD